MGERWLQNNNCLDRIEQARRVLSWTTYAIYKPARFRFDCMESFFKQRIFQTHK